MRDLWGLVYRLADGRLEHTALGFVFGLDWTAVLDKFLADCLDRAGRPADRTFIVQSFDHAFSDLRSYAFGRHKDATSVSLIPDIYFMRSRGYAQLREQAETTPAWADRAACFFWRGSANGRGVFAGVADIPRIRLATNARDFDGADVGIIGEGNMEEFFALADIRGHCQSLGLWRSAIPMLNHGRYRYTFDIDGHANAWGLLERMLVGCCVLKVGSSWEQWFYHRLRPWEHYIPVAADLSDQRERMDWCLAHDEAARGIAEAGRALARSITYEAERDAAARLIFG